MKKEYIRQAEPYTRTIHLLDHTGDIPAIQKQKLIPVVRRITAGRSMYAEQKLAVCKPQPYACNREIVVVLIHSEEATLKRIFRHPHPMT